MRDEEVKRRTGFTDEKAMLTYINRLQMETSIYESITTYMA